MPKRSLLTAIATLITIAPAFAHLDPVAHGMGEADHNHAFIGIEPFVLVGLAVIAVLAVAGGVQRARAAARKGRRDDPR